MEISTITLAINERRKVKFIYQGKDRIVDPHIFGINSRNEEVILGWQTDGSSSKIRDLPNWRMFITRKIYDFQITNNSFIPKGQYYKSDINTVYATVW
jgi:hypothetical protein